MNVLIVEDEMMARKKLAATLTGLYPGMKIAGETGSVEETLSWLRDPSHKADIIFMDVELSDGNCFEIFRKTDIKANVIMTTAYDNYAVKAFEVESIDYLLKPVEEETLKRAVDRCISRQGGRKGGTRKRILVKLNDTIVPVLVSDIAYLYAEDKSTYLVTKNRGKYIVDFSLDIAMEQLDHETFYRISRNCIISMQAISRIVKIGRRYKIDAQPAASFEMIVSRSRTDDFLDWLEEK